MKVLIAPDSFKQTLTAAQAAAAIARGWQAARPADTLDFCPMADGGEGTVEALVRATGGAMQVAQVHGPLAQPVDARWGVLGDGKTAVIEMAQAAGLELIEPAQQNPMLTTTYGVGQLILAALDHGCRKILIGIGGSATTDGGTGMAQALGAAFTRPDGAACVCGLAGGGLATIDRIDMSRIDRRLRRMQIIAACDVTNPLTGLDGAAHVYSPQKGATPQQVEQLDAGLAHLASLVPGVDANAPGMGAAGGLGFGLVAFCHASLQRGIEIVMDAVGFDKRVAVGDLVITGEGRIDGQSISGKTVIGIAQRAESFDTPTVALVGGKGPDADACLDRGLSAIHAIVDEHVTLQQALAEPAKHLEALAERVARSI